MLSVEMDRIESRLYSFTGESAFFLENLPKEIQDDILSKGSFIIVNSQENLTEIGEYCNKIFYILEGAFVCQYFDEDLALERTVNFHIDTFHPFMTSVESFFYEIKSKYRLKAVTQSKVISFNKTAINELIEKNPAINRLCFEGLTSVLTSEIKLRSKLTTLPADKLYLYLINQHPQIIQQIPSKYIAEFMGITQEWLSKLKRKK
jgi:CRP-like cAMP-binding protein